MNDPLHVVFDDSAMVAAGAGNVMASGLIHRAHEERGWFVYAPMCALVEADRVRPGIAEHIASLPSVVILDLDLASALAVARDAGWAQGHVRYAAQPCPDRILGAVVATVVPEQWKDQGVRVLDLRG